MQNARKNPKVSTKCRNTAISIFVAAGTQPTGNELERITGILYNLWNIDGIDINEDNADLLLHPKSKWVQTHLHESATNGSGYMSQLMAALTEMNVI